MAQHLFGHFLRRQRGAALIVMMTVAVIGIAWYTVGAMGKAAPSAAEREIRTGESLRKAKQALLAYVALKAADTTEGNPGRLPCPENPNYVGTSDGKAAPIPGPFPTCTGLGRLPWRTLGIDQLRDGDGEPLWYAASLGVWTLQTSTTPTLTINPGIQGQLQLDGAANAAVALIIAPGAAVNSTSQPGPPPAGCTAVNQQNNRYAVPYAVGNFLECGNATGSYTTAGVSPWSNDRVLAVTAAEVMDAISGAVADRLQREVAPALESWRQTEANTNWGIQFLPYASTFSDPSTNDLCGNNGITEGVPPTARNATSGCSRWSSGSVSKIVGFGALQLFPFAPFCFQTGTAMRCTFLYTGILTTRVTVTAPNVAGSFRSPIRASDVSIVVGGGTVSNLSVSLSAATGQGTATFDISPPWPPGWFFGGAGWVTVDINNLPDAAILTDPRMVWFLNNGWDRFVYYAAAPGATASPTAVCAAAGDPGCLQVRGLPDSTTNYNTGNHDDKRFALVLAGNAVTGQSRTPCPGACDVLSNFLEEQNASTGDRIFRADLRTAVPAAVPAPHPAFNDHVAACPFQFTPQSGPAITVCN